MNITKEKRARLLTKRNQNKPIEDGTYKYNISNIDINSNVLTKNGIATDVITIKFILTNETNEPATDLTVKYYSFLKDYNSSKRFYYFLNMVERAYKDTTMYDEIFPTKDDFKIELLLNTTGTLEVKNNEYNGKKYSNVADIFPDISENSIVIDSISEIDKAVNISAENEVKTLNTEKFKAVISGDKMSINRNNKQHLQVALSCKLIMLTNNLPNTNDTSLGFFRKVMIIPFNNIIPEDEVDINLFDKLKLEKSGILNWALDGLKRLVNNGYKFSKCNAIDDITTKYQRNQNDVEMFINECVKYSTNDTLKSKVYNIYNTWCELYNINPKGRLTFWEKFRLHFMNVNNPYRVKSIRGTEYICNLEVSIN